MRARHLLLAAALGAGLTVGCRSGGATYESGGDVANGTAALTIDNQNVADMDIYVVSAGLATRIGTVNSHQTGHFRLTPSMFPAGDLMVVATPIGGMGRASTGNLPIQPGQTAIFTIAPVLRQSTAVVR